MLLLSFMWFSNWYRFPLGNLVKPAEEIMCTSIGILSIFFSLKSFPCISSTKESSSKCALSAHKYIIKNNAFSTTNKKIANTPADATFSLEFCTKNSKDKFRRHFDSRTWYYEENIILLRSRIFQVILLWTTELYTCSSICSPILNLICYDNLAQLK